MGRGTTTAGAKTGRGRTTTTGAHTGGGATTTGAVGTQTGGTGAHTTRGGSGNPIDRLKLKSARAGLASVNPRARAPIPIMVLVFITMGSTWRG
ncbi:hypothetical protein GC207_04040 [bacterium]|nr:hypothetical protein [bacterium]